MATALKKRLVKTLPFTLDVPDIGELDFQLCYDFNAMAALQEKTVSKKFPSGINLTDLETWRHTNEPGCLTALFWAATITRHPEYNSDEGLATIGTYIDEGYVDAIQVACWDAYLLNVPQKKREFMEELKRLAEADIKSKAEAAKKPDPPSPAAADPQPESSTGLEPSPLPESTSDLAKTSSAS
jgi:hypothetical protein